MEKLFANIIVDISHEKVDRTFQYIVPEFLTEILEVGMCVNIPFGNGNKLISGYVLEITNEPLIPLYKLKEIKSLVEKGITAESNSIRLAYWMKKQYGSTMITALKTVLPVKQKQIQATKKNIAALLPVEKIKEAIITFEAKHQKGKVRLLQEFLTTSQLPYSLVTTKLNISASTIKSLENEGIIQITTEHVYRNPIKLSQSTTIRKQLSIEQQQIIDDIIMEYKNNQNGHYLIHGITGSGKTEVYMELIEQVIEMGKQAIMLIPEIALTYQTVLRFYQRFGERVTVVNSKLSQGEKYDQFQRAKKGEVDVVIGPRSSLFVPFKHLGIIIIDEEHESSYKSETMPKYHAREVAMELASYHKASVILGSATPSLESYYMAEQGTIKKYELNRRLTGGTLPNVFIEDLREELKCGNRTIFSRRLYELILDRLKKKQQIILFLNRRGYAGFISCRACGYVVKCPHCDVSLSEHKGDSCICHYCGFKQKKVSVCPNCNSKYIMGFKAGTQQIEEQLWRQFPQAKTLRMDADTTKSKDSYEEILSQFASGEADILLGTQMIVKGHDFPNVTLVGILAADMSLFANDYRAGERTFALLTQAAGRAGRGDISGDVVIQTYQPEHYSIVHAANQDYKSFYQEEMLYRDFLKYPPAAHMMAVQIMSKVEKKCEIIANSIGNFVHNKYDEKKVVMVGPAPATIGKVKDIYRYVLYIKHQDRDVLVDIKDQLEKEIQTLELKQEIVQFDFDPIHM